MYKCYSLPHLVPTTNKTVNLATVLSIYKCYMKVPTQVQVSQSIIQTLVQILWMNHLHTHHSYASVCNQCGKLIRRENSHYSVYVQHTLNITNLVSSQPPTSHHIVSHHTTQHIRMEYDENAFWRISHF